MSKLPSGKAGPVGRSDFFDRVNLAWETFLTSYYWAKGKRTAPPPGSQTEFGQLLWRASPPLIHPRARVLVLYSPKAACTQVMIWFLHQLGHLRAARDFHVWPHDYRDYVYRYSELYRNAYAMDFTKFKVIRVVRDPYERTVSSYRHMLGYGFRRDSLSNRLRYWNIRNTGLSFAEFLDCLERSDLTRCNPHYRIQRHPIEDILPVHYLINVSNEDLFKRLNEIEPEIGLPRSNIAVAAADWLKELNWHKRPQNTLIDDGHLYTRRLTWENARVGPWPHYDALLTPQARERIRRCYAVDFEAYFQEPTKAPSISPAVQLESAS